MKLSSYMIALILVGAVVMTSYLTVGDLMKEENYNVTIDTHYNTTYNKIDDLITEIEHNEQVLQNISSKEDKSFFTGTWDMFLFAKTVVWGTVTGLTGSLGVGSDIIRSALTDFSVPLVWQSVLIGLLTLGVVAALISLVMRWKF